VSAPLAAREMLNELAADRPGPVIAGVHSPDGARELFDGTGRWPGLLGVDRQTIHGQM
jgi:hypothetical protein